MISNSSSSIFRAVFAISISRFLFMSCFLASNSILSSSASNRLDERDFVSKKPKVNHNLNFPLLDLQSDRTMKEPTHDYIYNVYEEPSHFNEQKSQATCIEAMIKPLRKPTLVPSLFYHSVDLTRES
jgi:hypothetical protein